VTGTPLLGACACGAVHAQGEYFDDDEGYDDLGDDGGDEGPYF
jgi:hypothetical protein